MSLKMENFEFGEFSLDTREKVLLRNRKRVSITPKAFLLLKTLIENHGHTVPKGQLMEAVWPDSYVEEGNLTFTINLLRKVLGDNSQAPRYIETLPKHGYRFVADVHENLSGTGQARGIAGQAASAPETLEKPRQYRVGLWVVVSILIISGFIFGGWLAFKNTADASAPVLSAPFVSEKLSISGKVYSAAISPDGRKVVYTTSNNGKQSVWLRQLESADNVQIIPPSDDDYYSFAFSPVEDVLYFTRRPKRMPEGQIAIYRIPVYGGIPTKIVSGPEGWLSLSPDGKKISFVRCPYKDDEYCSLWIADAANGANERKLLTQPRPIRIGDNRISPDGKKIAFAFGQSENAANEFSLAEIDIESGTQRDLSKEKFFNIKHLSWLPGESGLLITAAKIPNKRFSIWHVSASGNVLPVTKDSETYSVLSVDSSASNIVSTQVEEDFRLRLFKSDNPAAGLVLSEATDADFVSDGKILYSSSMTGNSEIWMINPDGSGQRQLTTDPADDTVPVASPDKSFVYFESNRTGEAHVWRMNLDGSNQTQITRQDGGFPIFVSPDGTWLYYHHGADRTLWRVSLKSGEEQKIWDQGKYFFSFSPDGSQFAFTEKQDGEKRIVIVSVADRKPLKIIPYPDPTFRMLRLKWLRDGSGLIYILSDSEYEQHALWQQPFDGSPPRKIADLGDDEVAGFALAPDGQSYVISQGRWKHDAVLIKGLK